MCQLTCIRATLSSIPFSACKGGNRPCGPKPTQPKTRARRSNVVMQGDDGSAPRHQYYANCDLGSGTCPSPSCVASLGAATDAGTECRLNTGCALETTCVPINPACDYKAGVNCLGTIACVPGTGCGGAQQGDLCIHVRSLARSPCPATFFAQKEKAEKRGLAVGRVKP